MKKVFLGNQESDHKTGRTPLFILSLIVALVVAPMGAYGIEEASGPPPTPLTGPLGANTPPVEQPLVPEGVFAVQLVEALKMGRVSDEAQAESMLSGVGIEPKNGWIAGYPVTPPVIGEVEKGVAAAADAGKLSMGKEQARKAVGDLKAKLGLSVTSEAPPSGRPGGPPISDVIYKYTDKDRVIHFTNQYETIPKEYRNQVETIQERVHPPSSGEPVNENTETANNYLPNPNPEVINDYYYNDGPPVVTYYPPPDPYYYLYSWVPYPFWYSGFFCRGFFVLHDFHRRIFVNGRPFMVTNHVVNAGTHKTFMVEPATGSLRGSTVARRVTSPQTFNSAKVQPSARTIVGLSQNRMVSANVATAPGTAKVGPSSSMSSPQGPTRSNLGTLNEPMSQPRNNFVASQVPRGGTFSPPPVSERSFSAASPVVFSAPANGGRGSFGGSRGGGGRGGHR